MFKIKKPIDEIFYLNERRPYGNSTDASYIHMSDELANKFGGGRNENTRIVPWKVSKQHASFKWDYMTAYLKLYTCKKFINHFIDKPMWVEELQIKDRKALILDLLDREDKTLNEPKTYQQCRVIMQNHIPHLEMILESDTSDRSRWYPVREYCNTLAKSITYITELRELTSDWAKQAKTREKMNFGKASMSERLMKKFRPIYNNYFRESVKNAEGVSISGTWISETSLHWSVYRDSEGWWLDLAYGSNSQKCKLDRHWKKTVGEEGIAVSDKKIVLKAEVINTEEVNGLPCKVYKADWLQRTSNPLDFKLIEGGYIVKLGDAKEPIAIRTTEHMSQCHKIAENTATREFFKRMVNDD